MHPNHNNGHFSVVVPLDREILSPSSNSSNKADWLLPWQELTSCEARLYNSGDLKWLNPTLLTKNSRLPCNLQQLFKRPMFALPLSGHNIPKCGLCKLKDCSAYITSPLNMLALPASGLPSLVTLHCKRMTSSPIHPRPGQSSSSEPCCLNVRICNSFFVEKLGDAHLQNSVTSKPS